MSINTLYKLSSGETIISNNIVEEITSTNNTYVTFRNPLAIMMQPNQKGGIEFGIIPWMHGDVKIKVANVIGYSDAPDELDKEYTRITTSIQMT